MRAMSKCSEAQFHSRLGGSRTIGPLDWPIMGSGSLGGRAYRSRSRIYVRVETLGDGKGGVWVTYQFETWSDTALAKLIVRAKVIVWDEAAMANRYHLEALDLTLRDLHG